MSEEVSQEVFVEVWRLARRFDGSCGSARAWIVAIAHRRAVDRVRSEQAQRDRDTADATVHSPDAADASDELSDRLDGAQVVVALESLSSAQRQSVEPAFYGGRTYREVAALFDVLEGTVKTRILDRLIRLRDPMEVTT
jgi:RNA polymerase sigma-70 factor (ECF subfamily)